MDWTTIGAWILGGGGLASGVWSWLATRKINNAQAKQTDAQADATIADYTQTVIEQANERVKQALSDRDRYIAERDDAWCEMKSQREDKRRYRTLYHDEERAHHATQLHLKDIEADGRYYRCEVDCPKRKPPRELPAVAPTPPLETV